MMLIKVGQLHYGKEKLFGQMQNRINQIRTVAERLFGQMQNAVFGHIQAILKMFFAAKYDVYRLKKTWKPF